MDFPFVYLSVPIGANPRRESVWSKVLEKCRKKLSVWRQKTLSLGGKVTFINLVFSSIPLFFLSFLKIFVGVAKKIISSYAKEFFVGLWSICFLLVILHIEFGMGVTQSCQLIRHFHGFQCTWFNAKKNTIWLSEWCVVVWSLWSHRNKTIFQQFQLDFDIVMEEVIYKSWTWPEA
ncbi:hypothetical protein glysoja_025785, partial [Glycine soja]